MRVAFPPEAGVQEQVAEIVPATKVEALLSHPVTETPPTLKFTLPVTLVTAVMVVGVL